jgi:hypothetical protein
MQQNNTKILDEIINAQRSYHDRSGLGYNQTHTEKGSSSMTTEEEENKGLMQKSPEDSPRRKNASPLMRMIRKKITEGWHHLEDLGFRINNHPWKEIKKKTTEEQHHSEDLPGIKLSFLVHVILVIILGTKL